MPTLRCDRCCDKHRKCNLKSPCNECHREKVNCVYSQRKNIDASSDASSDCDTIAVQRPADPGRAVQQNQTPLNDNAGAPSRSGINDDILVPNSQKEDEGIEAQVPTPTSTLLNHVPWSDLLDDNYIPIIDQVHQEETNRKHPLMIKTPLEDFRVACVQILASMHDEVLQGLVNGDLAKRYAEGDDILVKLYGDPDSPVNTTWMKNADGSSPALYGRTLVDNEGNPPDPNQKLKIVQTLRRYVSRDPKDIDIAIAIDARPPQRTRSASNKQDIADGRHLYLCNQGQRIDARVARIESFCTSAEAIYKSPPSTKIANAAWFYIGWSMVPMDRLKSYETGKESFLISLIARICEVLFPGQFKIDNFILVYLATEEESAFGEILLTGIAGAYHHGGTGLCVHPAGMNNSSARMEDVDVREAKQMWATCLEWRKDKTPFIENMHRLQKVLKNGRELNERIEAKRAKNLTDLRAKLNGLRPDYESSHRSIVDQLSEVHTDPEIEEALGDFGDVYQTQLQCLLDHTQEDTSAWDE